MGNDVDEVDEISVEILDYFADALHGKENCLGGIFRAGTGSAMYYLWHADRELHKKYTGVYNDLILENFEHLKRTKKDYIIRTPLITGICDTEENLAKIKEIIGDSPWEKLTENAFRDAKYSMLI